MSLNDQKYNGSFSILSTHRQVSSPVPRRIFQPQRQPIRLLTLLLLLGAAMCVWLGWDVYHAYELIEHSQSRRIRQQQLHGTILQLDEILTMSARMAAATGDLTWEDRYNAYAPKLDAAIAEAKQLMPAETTSAIRTESANQQLVALEQQAFQLIRAGRQERAAILLSSPTYAEYKTIYSQGMADYRAASSADLEQAIAEEKAQTALALGVRLVLVTLGLLSALLLLRRGIIHSLHRLALAATAVSNGVLNEEVPITSDDVIGTLQYQFNHMVQTIQTQTQSLSKQITAAETARRESDAARLQVAEQLQTIQEQQMAIQEMSIPILPLTKHAMVMPLVGVLDSSRLMLAQQQALQALERSPAHHFILDVTGVPVIDTLVVKGLMNLIQSCRLLGAEVILVGIRPEVAQTIVGLGIETRALSTRNSLQNGIAYILGNSDLN